MADKPSSNHESIAAHKSTDAKHHEHQTTPHQTNQVNVTVNIENTSHSTKEEERFESKSLLIGAAVIIGLILIIFLSIKYYPTVTGAKPMTISELHQQNFDGELPPDQGIIYNGFSFIKLDGLWWGEVQVFDQPTRIRLHYSPKELDNITISGQLNESFNQGPNVYQAINPDLTNKYYTLALTELNSNIAQGMHRTVVGACTKEDDICTNRTIVSCNNTQGLPVLELIPSDETKVVFNGSCIGMYGNESDLTRAAERVLYKWYGVMK